MCGFGQLADAARLDRAARPFCGADDDGRSMMKCGCRPGALLFVLAVIAGCTSSTSTAYKTPVADEPIARPDRIWVYEFANVPKEVPADSAIAGQISAPSEPQTPQQITVGDELGRLIAESLVADIQAMGFSAVQAGPGSSPQVGDGVIRGSLISVEGGSAVKRFVMGFGSGTSEMDAVVEAYVMTPEGLRKVGSGVLTSSGSKMPGIVMPGAVAIATANPIGLIVVGVAKTYDEVSGRTSLQQTAKATADEIASQLRVRMQKRGWISEG